MVKDVLALKDVAVRRCQDHAYVILRINLRNLLGSQKVIVREIAP